MLLYCIKGGGLLLAHLPIKILIEIKIENAQVLQLHPINQEIERKMT